MGDVMNELVSFFSERKADKDKGIYPTHTGMFFPCQGSWRVLDEDLPDFWDLYNNVYKITGGGTMMNAGITEVQPEWAPILVDIDFKYPSARGSKRRYTSDDVLQVLHLFRDTIRRYVKDPCMNSFVFEKKSPRRLPPDQIKDGFHAMFDQVVAPKDVRKRILRDVSSALDKRTDIFMRLYTKGVVDDCAATNNWLMYGCMKKDDPFPYVLTGMYDGQTLNNDVPEVSDTSVFRIRNRERSEMLLTDLPEEPHEQEDESTVPEPPVFNAIDERKVGQLLRMLKLERVHEEPSWIRVGWCLHNVSESFLPLWIEWSRQSDKFRDGDCEKQWKRFRKDGYKLPSLYNWARNDSPEQYEIFVRENAKIFLEYSINCGAHYDIAAIMYSKYNDIFRAVSPKKSEEWYYFDNHRWKEMPGGYILMNKMSKELSKDFADMAAFHRRNMISTDPTKMKEHKEKRDKCARLEYQVKDNGFKTGVLKECARMFFDGEFKDKLDTDCNLVCFENGMYDISRDEFRDGQPDDNVSKCTGITYNTDYSMDHEIIQEIFGFLRKVQPDPGMLDYVMTVLASFLGGSTEEQTFQIWTGSGSNGKSTIIELFEKTFGDDYCGKFPVTLLTKDRASSNACTPELQDVMRKRFASMQEPNDNDLIYTGAMKEYTGGDKIYSRGLFSTPTPFKPQFKLVLLCNKMPQIKGWDYGTWRRIRVVNFTSSFVDEPSPENEQEFKKDKTLSSRFDGWREGFMWLLVWYLKRYKKGGVRDPESVSKASMDYKKKSDMYLQFMDDNFETTNKDTDRLSAQEMYDAFKMWWRNMNTTTVPSKTDFMEYMNANTKLKRSGKQTFVGLKYMRQEEL